MFIKSVVNPIKPTFNPFSKVFISQGKIPSSFVLSITFAHKHLASKLHRYFFR